MRRSPPDVVYTPIDVTSLSRKPESTEASASAWNEGVGGLGHIGGAVHPVRNRRPGIFGYRLDEIPQAGALADGDGEADIHPAADGDHGVGIEAAVGPHRELAPGSAVAHPPHRFTQAASGGAMSANWTG